MGKLIINGDGSKPINTIFRGMNIHKSQLFWCEQKGYMVLTHPQMTNMNNYEYGFCDLNDLMGNKLNKLGSMVVPWFCCHGF